MQIRNNTLITECSAYDFKELLERKKVKSWLKSVSAFANTEASSFFTTFYNLNWGENARMSVEEVANRVNNTLEKYPVNEKSTLERYPVKQNLNKPVGRTAQRIIDMVISNPMITREKMADELGISLEGVKKQIKNLKDRGILVHEGSDKTGYWRFIIKP